MMHSILYDTIKSPIVRLRYVFPFSSSRVCFLNPKSDPATYRNLLESMMDSLLYNTIKSPIIRLRLSISDVDLGDYGCDPDDGFNSSSLEKLLRYRFYILLMRDRLSYSCIPVGSLICPSVGRQVPESEVPVPGTKCPESLIRCTEATFIPDDSNQYRSNVEYIINARMSSVVCGNKIYMLGGTKGFYNYSRLLSPDVMQFEIKGDRILGDPNSYLKNPMLSDKGLDSIALHHNNMLYVLANNSFGIGTDDNTFESYNVKDDQWSLLEPPPFYRAYLSSVREIVSYVVIGDNICVSTKLAAFSYNISSNQWESCSLFDGFSLSRDDYDDEVWKRCEETKIKGGEANGIKFGQPFDFLGEGLLFEDFLIGANWIEESVVAYRIVDGKVKQSRRLFYVPKPRDSSQDHYLYYLLELGEGYFTVAFFTETNTSARTVTLVIVVFHVSREIEASGDIFLSSKICCTHEIKTPREDSNGLTDPLFFTMQEGGDGDSGVLRST